MNKKGINGLPSHSTQNYFFVPLGREIGGLLELLGLPPTASDFEVSDGIGKLLDQYDSEYRAQRKLPSDQLQYTKEKRRFEQGEITRKEFEEKTEETISELMPPELKVKLDYDQLQEKHKAGELTEKEYNYKLKQIISRMGGKELYKNKHEISNADFEIQRNAFIAQLENLEITPAEIQNKRDKIREQLESGEITQEEFDRLDKEWQEKKTAQTTQLLKLKAAYDKKQSQEREHEQKGFPSTNIIWQDMNSNTSQAGKTTSEWRRSVLTYADQTWHNLDVPGRDLWKRRLQIWADIFRALGPTFSVSRLPEAQKSLDRIIPHLSLPHPRLIQHLEDDDLEEEISQQPDRRRSRTISMDDLMQAMLNELEDVSKDKAASGKTKSPEMDKEQAAKTTAKEFLEFLEALADQDEHDTEI